MSDRDYVRLVNGQHPDPHSLLGAHPAGISTVVRTFKPLARSVAVLVSTGSTVVREPMQHEAHGIWRTVLPQGSVPDYRLEVTYDDGVPHVVDDPYRYLPTLGEVDLHLINEGRHERLWEVLGAHVRRYHAPSGDVTGTSFAVWAPHAKGVRVKGDFDSWDGREHPMRRMGASGVWELFVPGIGSGMRYKYDVLGADGVWREKADPLATHTEVPPQTSSVVYESGYSWGDAAWLEQRARHDPATSPMSIYEVHLGSWRRGRSYSDLAEELVAYVTELGFTHVELLPVMEHPFGGSWGYQVTSYFAPTARWGTPDDLRYLIDRLHQAGIGVILDWVPAHFPRDSWALARFDGSPLYEDSNPQRGEHPEWGTLVFDYGRHEVRNFLYASALFWLEEFHADGLRVDAVASLIYLDYARKPGAWAPNAHGGRENLEAVQFVKELNATCYKRVPGIVTIAEESTSWPGVTRPTDAGGLGFGLKWDMGWMHDTLGYLAEEPFHRSHHHDKLSFSMMYAYSEGFVLPLSHDEVVHGKGSLLTKMPGDRRQQLATVRAMLAYQWAHPGKQLVFMGAEIGQEAEWAEHRELDWWLLDHPEHRGVQRLVADLNRVYAATPALWRADADPAGFRWIDADDAWRNTYSFLRFDPADPDSPGGTLACVVNFSGVAQRDLVVGLPRSGRWDEVLNTAAAAYAGSGEGNLGAVTAADEPAHGLPASARVTVPALGAVWLKPSLGG